MEQHAASVAPATGREPPLALSSVELFTGGGGLALGTHAAGFRHAALLERNADACDTIRANVAAGAVPGIGRWVVHEGDVRAVDFGGIGPVDLVAGGPPCQPFSLGGKHGAFADPRNMIPEFCRAVRELQPRAFIMENVRGLTRAAFAPYFDYVLRQLALPGLPPAVDETWEEHDARLRAVGTPAYRVQARVLDAADYGVPQHRHRVFVVGFRADLPIAWSFPAATHSGAALWASQWASGEYWRRHAIAPPAAPPSRRPAGPEGLRPWRTLRDAIGDLPEPEAGGGGPFNHRLVPGARAYPGHTGSPVDLPSKALKAGVHGVPGGENTVLFPGGRLRYLTVREAARVQTFPDGWRLEGAWGEAMRQIGNAVPVKLAEAVARSVATALA
ncbi:MAG: DNA (cytosine-5-)-methyltransferase [Deltaproteobacteria bacterium]|nr:DNA (cytosine-5-)-methyltransferase [Deltaproteobacteria bacterium]